MKNSQYIRQAQYRKAFIAPLLLVVIILLVVCVGVYFYETKKAEAPVVDSQTFNLPTTCVDEQEGVPIITSLSSYSGSVGTKLEINGCNFAGFEGDKNAWIENSQGVKGILRGESDSSAKSVKVTLQSSLCQIDTSYSGLPCDATLTLTPGLYKIYVSPWDKESNKVDFTIISQ